MTRFLELKNMIEKMAQVPTRSRPKQAPQPMPAPKGTPSSVPTKGKLPSSNTKGVVKSPQSSISTMQSLLKDLGQTINTDQFSENKFKENFNNLVAQYSLTPQDEQNKANLDPNPTSNLDMKNAAEFLSKIKVDGGWGPLTTQGLAYSLKLAISIMRMVKDLKNAGVNIAFDVYKEGNLNEFYQLLPQIKDNKVMLTFDEKRIRATELTKHLKAIISLYHQVMDNIINKLEFRPLLDEKSSFENYTSVSSGLAPSELNFLSENMKAKYPVNYIAPKAEGGKMNYIPMYALTSKEQYFKWMSSLGVNEETATKIFNNVIRPQIEGKSQ